MTTAVLLRSGMTRKCHVPFCRAVEGATLSLTLIIRDEGLRILNLTSGTGDKAMKCTSAFEKEYSVSKRDGSWGGAVAWGLPRRLYAPWFPP